jgi:hypothetical protein
MNNTSLPMRLSRLLESERAMATVIEHDEAERQKKCQKLARLRQTIDSMIRESVAVSARAEGPRPALALPQETGRGFSDETINFLGHAR